MREPSDSRATRSCSNSHREIDHHHPHYEPARLHRNDTEQVHLFVRPPQCIREHYSAHCGRCSNQSSVSLQEQMRDCSTQAAPQIEVEKSASAPAFFNSRPEHPKRKHVERQVPQIGVYEHVREWGPPPRREISDRKSERAKNLVRPDERQL